METITIEYCFTLEDGSKETFNFRLDAKTLELGDTPQVCPSWTNLDFLQCPNCPLTINTHQHCPLALRLVDIVNRFERLLSYDKTRVEVITEERVISQDTTAQRGISSLLGLVIATSGCPLTAFLKPMARFHLPFSSDEETIYRAASMYLLAQYFLKQEGRDADFELKGLKTFYRSIQVVNNSIAKRLRAASESDSAVNAVVLLDMYAMALPLVIEESLKEIRSIFNSYLSVQ